MRRILLAVWFGLWPLPLGVFLPYFQFPGSSHFLNVFWAVIDGLGLWTIDKTVGLRPLASASHLESRLVVLGVFVWVMSAPMLELSSGFIVS